MDTWVLRVFAQGSLWWLPEWWFCSSRAAAISIHSFVVQSSTMTNLLISCESWQKSVRSHGHLRGLEFTGRKTQFVRKFLFSSPHNSYFLSYSQKCADLGGNEYEWIHDLDFSSPIWLSLYNNNETFRRFTLSKSPICSMHKTDHFSPAIASSPWNSEMF